MHMAPILWDLQEGQIYVFTQPYCCFFKKAISKTRFCDVQVTME
uniref:Uncharacterized protein n=1 Tax=Rhizophora mucronata TaxID=61149 RepID=A0A2P2IXL7_RHIMU